ncbi:hypothetical protein QYE76_043830 [Lolium multiflorum]|uniref:Uncharacterized protein n=1 Tax=Lolium multiflorum TaxID=4521 RepID=A0AAD8WVW3_LOLMU|nr:hypothetical protein QYE76_043830 [Lolium multiflorum]
MDVKMDMELDMKTSHGRAREEREACMRGEDDVQAGARSGPTGRAAGPSGPRPGPTGSSIGSVRFQPAAVLVPTGHYPGPIERSRCVIQVIFHYIVVFLRCYHPVIIITTVASEKIGPPHIILVSDSRVSSENKNSADIITWREYEALRNERRREFRAQGDELKGTVQEISQKLDATSETVTTMKDQMTDIQHTLQTLQMSVDNLTNQQEQEDEDLDPQDVVPGRGVGRGNRPRGWAELGRHGHGHDEEDGLGKPKFSIPKFEGGADVEEYLTWELKIEKLWNLHLNYTEDRKIKLASSEFDGYALRWWDALVHNR